MEKETTRAYLIKITGDVQGVFYRHNAKKFATKIGIEGWIRNKQDGSVEAFIQGEASDLKKFIDWAHEGSMMATVDRVETESEGPNKKIRGFEIK